VLESTDEVLESPAPMLESSDRVLESTGLTGLDIRRERVARGWTQKQLAELIGSTDSSISHWELGTYGIDPDALARITLLFAKNLVPANGRISGRRRENETT